MFEPWCGPTFGDPGNPLGGMRLIVLGESHYVPGAPIGSSIPKLTKCVVEDYIGDEKSYPFFSRVMNIMLGGTGGSRDRREAFWNSVVFFNYIPVVAANRSGQRPRPDMWKGAAPDNFLSCVRRYEAEAVLVCGTQLWRNLPATNGAHHRYPAAGRDWDAREYEVAAPFYAVAAHIPHPTGSRPPISRCEPVAAYLRQRVAEMRHEQGLPALGQSPELR